MYAGRDPMRKAIVAIVRYENPVESVRRALDLSHGLDHLPAHAKVFIKPNIVIWTRKTTFPKWGVITTSRVIEDVVILLKERGIDHILIGEGTVVHDPKDTDTCAHAFEALGYTVLKKRYGVKVINIFERPFKKVDLGEGVVLNFNTDILESDFLVNAPVIKTHAQTVVSLGIKNLKGLIDIASRKRCHSVDPIKDLHYMVARLPTRLVPSLTILDGIYTNERGPSYDGNARRSNLLVASADLLSADMVGARLMGYDPSEVPHLVHAAHNQTRPFDLTDVEVVGERIEDVASRHEFTFPYNQDLSLPITMEKMGIKGLSYWKYDLTMCTYCSHLNGITLTAIAKAWKGQPWNDVEVLTGKAMRPTPGKKKTILLGKCMYQANRDHPDIEEMIAVKGCPPSPGAIEEALRRAGIEVEPAMTGYMDTHLGLFMRRYERRPEFDESFFKIV